MLDWVANINDQVKNKVENYMATVTDGMLNYKPMPTGNCNVMTSNDIKKQV
jgi:hypothetical protein